jgi:RNA polymerase sigma-70 factor (ECF subfamily)
MISNDQKSDFFAIDRVILRDFYVPTWGPQHHVDADGKRGDGGGLRMTATAELIARSQSGDHGAFAELVRRFERAVVVTTWAVLCDFHAAQDAGQETFLIAYQNLAKLRTPDAFPSWLLQIAKREALRAASRPKETASADPSTLESNSEQPEWADAYAGVIETLGRLPEHERTLVVLRYVDGHSMAEIAEMTGRPIGSVTKQLSRAIARLRKWFVEVPQ